MKLGFNLGFTVRESLGHSFFTAVLATQAGIEKLSNLRVLLMSNNRVKDWAEIEKLAGNTKLEELLFIGNPLVPMPGTPEYRLEVSIQDSGSCLQPDMIVFRQQACKFPMVRVVSSIGHGNAVDST